MLLIVWNDYPVCLQWPIFIAGMLSKSPSWFEHENPQTLLEIIPLMLLLTKALWEAVHASSQSLLSE